MKKIRGVFENAELNKQPQPEAPLIHSGHCYKCVGMIVCKTNYKLSRE